MNGTPAQGMLRLSFDDSESTYMDFEDSRILKSPLDTLITLFEEELWEYLLLKGILQLHSQESVECIDDRNFVLPT